MKKDRVVLAYSGGLDTSVMLHWLASRGFEVIALCVNLGQDEDFDLLRKKGLASGAVNVIVEDARQSFAEQYILPALQWNARYEEEYLLGTPLARPVIAATQIAVAAAEGAGSVANGCTGVGTDVMRYELAYYGLNPDISVIVPWRDPEFYRTLEDRTALVDYARLHNIPVAATREQPWSSDANLAHKSYEHGNLNDPWSAPHREMFQLTTSPEDAPNSPREVLLGFEEGVPVSLDGSSMSLVDLLERLNALGATHGIGRVDMMETRLDQVKQRRIYEAPGCTILQVAHRAIESLTLDHAVIDLKSSMMPRFAQEVYNGLWFSPVVESLLAFARSTQRPVTGDVRLKLYKGNCTVTGRRSPGSLYDPHMSSPDKHELSRDMKGMIDILSIPVRLRRQLKKK